MAPLKWPLKCQPSKNGRGWHLNFTGLHLDTTRDPYSKIQMISFMQKHTHRLVFRDLATALAHQVTWTWDNSNKYNPQRWLANVYHVQHDKANWPIEPHDQSKLIMVSLLPFCVAMFGLSSSLAVNQVQQPFGVLNSWHLRDLCRSCLASFCVLSYGCRRDHCNYRFI